MIMLKLLHENDQTSIPGIAQFTEDCIEDNFGYIEPFGPQISKDIEAKLIKSIESVKIFTTGITKIRDMIIELYSKFETPSEKCILM